MTPPPIIRPLIAADAAALRRLRLAGLQESPTAFASSYDEEKDSTVEDFAVLIGRNYMAGAFFGDELVGMAGFHALNGKKTSHRGKLWGVYLQPLYRGQGIASLLIEHILDHARSLVTQVHLSVVTENAAARHVYRRLGFSSYGIEPRSLRIGDTYYDEDLMVWRAD